jgi:hypothetical protein
VKAESYNERRIELDGWDVNLATYKIGETYYCHASNVSPGANIARAHGATREEAEQRAIERGREHLSKTRVRAV